MTENFNFLFQYLEKEYIIVDKTEFLFQIQSHPDYPSILSIADALSFFNIKNVVIRVDSAEIELLPEHYITVLTEENDRPTLDTALYFVEQKGSDFFITKDKKASEIVKVELELRWFGIVLLLGKSEDEETQNLTKNHWFLFFQIFGLLLFILVLFQSETAFLNNLFFIFPIIGILFSVAALKDLFGTKNDLLNKFCNLTSSTSCFKVVGSNKWKVFEVVNFSDLSIVFFSTQFIGLLVFLFAVDTVTYFSIQKIMLLGSIPVLFSSIYYQKFVEKKWCPICLVIISIILLELFYLFAFQDLVFTLSTRGLITFGFVFLSMMLSWSALKKLLINQKELKEYKIKSLRFERNYTIFKNSLLVNDKTDLPQSPIILGNKHSKTIITIISNPFCSHCKDAHEIMDAIIAKYHNEVQIQIILKVNLKTENEASKKLFRSLIEIYKQEGENTFTRALKEWFGNKNIENWISLFPVNTTNIFDTIFDLQYKWCEDNDFNFTPAIFINGYEYPQMYDRKNLSFYINEIIEDEF